MVPFRLEHIVNEGWVVICNKMLHDGNKMENKWKHRNYNVENGEFGLQSYEYISLYMRIRKDGCRKHLVAALDAVCYGSLFEAFLSAKSDKERGKENCKKKKVLGFYVEAFSSNEMQCPVREHKSICSRVGRSG